MTGDNSLCNPITTTVEQFSECLKQPFHQAIYFIITATLTSGLMYFYIYRTDLKLFKQARLMICRGISILTVMNSMIGFFIYCMMTRIVYPIYQKLNEIPEFRILIFFVSCYVIIDIIIFNRDENHIRTESDNLFSGFGLGTGITWLNDKIIGLIIALKYLNGLMAGYLFETSLEENSRKPLRDKLIERLNHTYPNTQDFIKVLRNRIENTSNQRLLLETLEHIFNEYEHDDQRLRRKLVEFAMEIYGTKTIEYWRDGVLPR